VEGELCLLKYVRQSFDTLGKKSFVILGTFDSKNFCVHDDIINFNSHDMGCFEHLHSS